jgi:hypothetical protein
VFGSHIIRDVAQACSAWANPLDFSFLLCSCTHSWPIMPPWRAFSSATPPGES